MQEVNLLMTPNQPYIIHKPWLPAMIHELQFLSDSGMQKQNSPRY